MNAPEQRSWKDRIFSLPVTMGYALAALVFIIAPRSLGDPDIWWHLRNAQILVETHHFITQDTFSFTAAHAAWMNHEWLAELPFYLGWRLDGAKGVWFAMALAIAATTLAIYLVSFRRSRSAMGSFAVAFAGMFLSSVSYGPRTVIFGWLLLLVQMYLLDRIADPDKPQPRLAWLLPPLYVVWVNTHGSWLIGLAVLVVYIATSAVPFQWGLVRSRGLSAPVRRSLIGATLASCAALFVNPYGWRLVAYPFNLAFHQKLNVENVEEWKPTDIHTVRGEILFGLILCLVIYQLYREREWELHDLAWIAIGLYSALSHTRFLYLFSVIAAPAFAARFPPMRRGPNYVPKPLLNLLTVVVLTVMAVQQVRHVKEPDSQKAMPAFPVNAARELEAMHLQGHVFNDFLWGGYMIFNMRDVPDFIDSRVDIFEYNGTFKDYLDIVRIKDSLHLLDQHQIRYVFFEQDTPLAYLLEHTPGWKIDYNKDNVVLLERTSTPSTGP